MRKPTSSIITTMLADDKEVREKRLQEWKQLANLTKTGFNVDNSALCYALPLPANYKFPNPTRLDQFSFHTVKNGVNWICTIHNGYAYGGPDTVYLAHENITLTNKFAPHDCSSLVSKYVAIPRVSTMQLYAFAIETSDKKQKRIDKVRDKLDEKLTLIDDAKAIRSADIAVSRNFPEGTDKNGLGKGGHTFFICNRDSSGGTIKTLELNRDMPNDIDGFGTRTLPSKHLQNPARKYVFF